MIRRHYALVTRIGGGMLVVVGLMLASGAWDLMILEIRTWVGGFETVP